MPGTGRSAGPGRLYCVPTPIASGRPLEEDLGPRSIAIVAALDYVVAESARTARAFLKRLPLMRPLQSIEVVELNEHTPEAAIGELLAPISAGRDAAIVSEAGCPGVADPGAKLVLAAHAAGVPVEPLVGPSALLLALMGSGLNGQCFAFAGYVPADPPGRLRRLRELAQRSRLNRETILMIETPYRNQPLFEALIATLQPQDLLCVAADLTGASQSLATDRVSGWRQRRPTLPRLPTVFLFLA